MEVAEEVWGEGGVSGGGWFMQIWRLCVYGRPFVRVGGQTFWRAPRGSVPDVPTHPH